MLRLHFTAIIISIFLICATICCYGFDRLPDGFGLKADEAIISAGNLHTCGIDKRRGTDMGGSLKCWGYNNRGQASPPSGIFVQVSAGHFHSCAVGIDGRMSCWGAMDFDENRDFARSIYDQVSSGDHHSCAIRRSDKMVECWGRNDFGESAPPKGSFAQVSCGTHQTCGILMNGTIRCWGKPFHLDKELPKDVQFKQISISTGPHINSHACGVTLDHEVKCWGSNARKQSEGRSGPYLQVSAGTRSTCAIREEDRALECWGSFLPIPEDRLNLNVNATQNMYNQVSSGHGHICAVDLEDEVHCWSSGAKHFGAHLVPLGFLAAPTL
uniref:non-specific serine/threonine protein kinase n=1 Tax=Leptocylindrus danicus TaxID=163516 RepID=A0A7S2K3D9_9STRA|mmetsp:Transcript_16986/g.25228  ORF Transcript_16986/g.25228 Transcript_16986/m.25228 type:complete len:327 (+) Transcript_16986:534-1514(+)